ncbi:Trp biosynthesis-associated membrane protein [Microcella sp.]|uniref:Trp biosynthesis-associated membrane protein n=1 Tax=Microcella sp. TaxID=1913979 RepID=UPI003F72C0B3
MTGARSEDDLEGAVPTGEGATERPGSRRVRTLALLLPVAAAAVAFLAWSQVWVSVVLDDGRPVVAAGDAAAPAVPPFAIAALALVGALALAGPVFRVVLGLLQALLGLGITVSGAAALADPLTAALAPLTEATGIDGVTGVSALVAEISVSIWPGIAIAAGAAALLIGIGIALTASRWPQRTRRYDAVRLAPTGDGDRVDRLDAWDALSDGDDPTAR